MLSPERKTGSVSNVTSWSDDGTGGGHGKIVTILRILVEFALVSCIFTSTLVSDHLEEPHDGAGTHQKLCNETTLLRRFCVRVIYLHKFSGSK
ncbi:hypothetical protein EVAR_57982_1 [Eumeta japonica]|uniref:Uncharacterized protein n=1 Tax=Eumeta variegata TaxID=151549 RepID=A0A4C1XWN4_EUMVA|nr:hypothetical protein EVAR_57982_1 [Eumeta japonica]